MFKRFFTEVMLIGKHSLIVLGLLTTPLTMAADSTGSIWEGSYLGLSLGAERSDADPSAKVKSQGYFTGDDFALVNPRASDELEDTHALGRIFWGINHQSGQLLYGLETDLSFSDFNEKNELGPVQYNTAPADSFTVSTQVKSDWALNLRARLGYIYNRSLFYFAAGPSIRKFDYDFTFTDTFQPQLIKEDQSKWKLGWTAGAGFEHQLVNDWRLRLEYRYSNYNNVFDSSSTTVGYPNDGFNHDLDLTSSAISIGISTPLE